MSSHPVTSTIEESIDCVKHMLIHGNQLTINRIANTISISHERWENIFHNDLFMIKVSTRWVPRPQTPEQQHQANQITLNFNIFKQTRMAAGFMIWAWNKENTPCCRKRLFIHPNEAQGRFHCWDVDSSRFFVMQMELTLLNIFESGHTNGNYNDNLLKHLRKRTCFIRTIRQHTRLWCKTVFLNWLITHYLLQNCPPYECH